MRSLILLDKLAVGGAERHAAQLVRRMPALGCEMTLAVINGSDVPNFPEGELPDDLCHLGAPSLHGLAALRAIGGIVRERGIDVVLAVNQTALVLSVLSRVLGFHKARVYCLFHTTIISTWTGRLKLPFFYLAVALSRGVIFVSRNQQAHWRRLRLPARRSVAIQNGVDPAHFAVPDPEQRRVARASVGAADDALVVVQCARFAPEKNQQLMVEGLRRAVASGLAVRVVFVGGGPRQATIRERVTDHGLDDHVLFAGEHRDVRPFLRAGDAIALTSNAVETFSLAALEGMSTGLAALLSDIGGASEIVDEGRTGLLFPSDDAEALFHALSRLADLKAVAAMGQAAAETVRREFTIDRMLAEYKLLLDGERESLVRPAGQRVAA